MIKVRAHTETQVSGLKLGLNVYFIAKTQLLVSESRLPSLFLSLTGYFSIEH